MRVFSNPLIILIISTGFFFLCPCSFVTEKTIVLHAKMSINIPDYIGPSNDKKKQREYMRNI